MDFKLISRYVAIIASLLVIGLLIYFFSSIVGYIAIAWVLSMIGQPIMRLWRKKVRIGKWRIGPNLASALTLITFFLILGLLSSLFVPLIFEQANNLAELNYSTLATALEEPILQANDWLSENGFIEPNSLDPEELITETFHLEYWFKPDMIGTLFSDFVATLGYLMISIFSIAFITFFFLKDEGLFKSSVSVLVPNRHEAKVQNAIDMISRLLTRYFTGVLLQITIITLMVLLGLTIFGVENALIIAFFAALINVIPYIGPIIGAAFGVFITISANLDLEFYTEMVPLILKVASVFAVTQLTDNFILQPFIFSTSVLAHPLEIFIVILMGAQLGGIFGMFLAIPSYTVLRVIARAFLSEFEVVQKLTGSIRDA